VRDRTEGSRILIDALPDGILVVEGGRVVSANPAALRLLGSAGPEEVHGRPVADLFASEDRERIQRSLDPSGPPFDSRVLRKDGSTADVEVAWSSFADGGRRASIVALRDTAERQRRLAALRDSEERLRLAFAGAQEGVWDWNLETNAVVYSPRWTQMLGYGDEEIEPHVSAWERLVHPDDRIRADEARESLAQGRPTYEAEFRLRHKNGHYVHVLSRGYPVRRQPGGPVVRIVGTHFDLTARKLAESTLRESEERLSLAFKGAQEGVWDWNLETGAVVYSTRWKEMLGYEDHEIEPHVSAWERLLHPDDRPRAEEVGKRVARGEPYEGEFRLRHKDGHYVHVLSRGFAVRREPAGPAVRIVGTHLDLTERRRAEAERARTELLTRLVFAQEDERRRIAREMHDQFGEQLTALATAIRTLKEASGGGHLSGYIETLEGVAQQLDRDVDNLVWELRPTALDDLGLRAALQNYVSDWSRRADISTELHTTGLADSRLPSETETALYRIAQEALTNVAKHSRARHVEIILERRSDQVLLAIEDDGVGFDPEAGPGATHGFGLIGMHERATLVGATLEIESKEGRGTTILVRLTAEASPREPGHV
jgi:PAS domain S-box-containing protein